MQLVKNQSIVLLVIGNYIRYNKEKRKDMIFNVRKFNLRGIKKPA